MTTSSRADAPRRPFAASKPICCTPAQRRHVNAKAHPDDIFAPYNADGRDSAFGRSGDDDAENTYHSFAISTR